MNKRLTLALAALALAACSSTRSSYSSSLGVSSGPYEAVCNMAPESIDIMVDTHGQPLSDVELVLADGSIVRPRAVYDTKGREIPLRWVADLPGGADGGPAEATIETVGQPRKLVAQFSRNDDLPGPRHLVLTAAAGESQTVLLASVKGTNTKAPLSEFGYVRQERTYPDGFVENVYVRSAPGGELREVDEATFEASVRPSIERMFAVIPTTAEELQDCTQLADFFASLFEEGYTYDGEAREVSASNPGSSKSFTVNPSRIVFYDERGIEQKVEDPISTATQLLLGALNARNCRELERLYDSARRQEINEGDFVRSEALFKARNVRTAVEMMKRASECMDIASWEKEKYGHYYDLYSRWVSEAEKGTESDEAAIHKLSAILLNSVSRRERSASGKPLTYARRLEQAYRELIMENR